MLPNIKTHYCRSLDIDDLIVLRMLGEKKTYVEIGKVLGLSSPSICHRVRKYEELWEEFSITMRIGRERVCSTKAQEVCTMAANVLEVLNEYEMEVSKCSNNADAVGTESAGGDPL
jgi:DNA-binding Lrp family transcriptional regulator